MELMKAAVLKKFGSIDEFQILSVPKPQQLLEQGGIQGKIAIKI